MLCVLYARDSRLDEAHHGGRCRMPHKGRKEADTCRDLALPALINNSGWRRDQVQEWVLITDGQIVRHGRGHRRTEPLRADYVLEISPRFPVGALEAKREHKRQKDGLEQAKEYAVLLHFPVAIATNGDGIVAFDFRTGTQQNLDMFPRPDELWESYRAGTGTLRRPGGRGPAGAFQPGCCAIRMGLSRSPATTSGSPSTRPSQPPGGRKWRPLTMATGTGKTFTAMQIVW